MRSFIVRHLLIILAVGYFAAGCIVTTEVLGFTGHLTSSPASCTYEGYPVQAGQLLDPHGVTLACIEGRMVPFPGPETRAAGPASATILQLAAVAVLSLRPVWDGHHPARWTGDDAMCPASSARLHRWARTGPGAPWFRVECLPDGPGLWAWNEITPKGR